MHLFLCQASRFQGGVTWSPQSRFKDNRSIIQRLDSGSFISSSIAYWALAYSIAICPEMVSWLENPTSMDLWLQTWVFLGFFSFWGFPECSGGGVASLCAWWQVNYGIEDGEQVRWDLLHLKTRSVCDLKCASRSKTVYLPLPLTPAWWDHLFFLLINLKLGSFFGLIYLILTIGNLFMLK